MVLFKAYVVINKLKDIDFRDTKTRGIVLASIGVVLLLCAGILMLRKADDKIVDQGSKPNTTQQAVAENITETAVTWNFDQNKGVWASSGTPPACANPYVFFVSPVDVSKASSILYPGQTRGGNYKPHGGFRFDGSLASDITVTLPTDAILIGGSRYIESGEVQYLLDFQSQCGIAFRFDHLLTLSPIFQDIVNKFPEAKVDDSRGTFISPAVEFKAGVEVATAVGFSKTNNVGVDFGVYDYRAPNEASKNGAFAQAHKDFSATAYYGACWFDMLPSPDAARVKKLPAGDQKMGKKSDYCK